MRVVLFLISILAFIDGFVQYSESETIMQQIASILIIIGGCILFSGASIIDAIVNLKNEIHKKSEDKRKVD